MDISWLWARLQLLKETYPSGKGVRRHALLLRMGIVGGAVGKDYCSPCTVKSAMTVLNFSTTATGSAGIRGAASNIGRSPSGSGSFTRAVAQKTESPVSAYRYSSEDAEYSFWFAEPGKPWRQGVVSSDAGFVCWSQSPASLLILATASYAVIEGGLECASGGKFHGVRLFWSEADERCSRPILRRR